MKDIKNYLAEILTGIIIIALIIYSFVGMGLKDTIDDNFWTAFAVNLSIMLLITSIWFPSAKQKAQYNDTGYLNQRKAYGLLVDKIIDTNNQKGLSRFCEYAKDMKIKLKMIADLSFFIFFSSFYSYKSKK